MGLPSEDMLRDLDEETYKQGLKRLMKKLEYGYECSLCGKQSNYSRVILAHVEAHHIRLGRYTCRYCNKKFNTYNSKKMHINSTHRQESILSKAFGSDLVAGNQDANC